MPLAMIAVSLAGVWWAWLPLVGGAAWWGPRPARGSALVALQTGVVGTEWAAIGAWALAAFPRHRVTVGILWIAAAGFIAAIAAANRRRTGEAR